MKGRTDEAQAHRRLWIDQYGGPMQVPALRLNIEAVTKAAFGTAIWPHLFRDCAFTTLAIERPEDLWAGTEMLDHLSQATGEKHYNQATMLQASLAYTNNIIEQRTAYIDEILAAQAEEAAWVAQQHSGSAAAADPPAPSSFTR